MKVKYWEKKINLRILVHRQTKRQNLLQNSFAIKKNMEINLNLKRILKNITFDFQISLRNQGQL